MQFSRFDHLDENHSLTKRRLIKQFKDMNEAHRNRCFVASYNDSQECALTKAKLAQIKREIEGMV